MRSKVKRVKYDANSRHYLLLNSNVHQLSFTTKAHKDLKYRIKSGAGDEIRTHDPNLGKVVLYH